MVSWRRRFRGFALTWGVLQLILPLLVLFGDAAVARAGSLRPTLHIEASSGESCRAVHTDDCALCRFLSHNTGPAVRAELPVEPATVAGRPSDALRVARFASPWQLPATRAPPTR
jgi:hypothetical protein